MPKVCVIGDTNVDIIVQFPQFKNPERTSVIWPNPVLMGGGTCSNTAAALAKLGLHTVFIGCTGDDEYGRFVRKDLEETGVDISQMLVHPHQHTVGVFAFVDEVGERYLWGWPRHDQAFKHIGLDEIDLDAVLSCDWIHSSGMAITYDTSARRTITHVFAEAHKRGIPTSFDLNLRVDDGVLNEEFAQALQPLLETSRYVLGSGPDEFAYLGNSANWMENAQALVTAQRSIIVRDGARGSWAITDQGMIEAPAFKVEVVDTIGAGDVYNAGFMYAQLNDLSMEESLRIANAVSGYKVAHQGPRSSPNLPELQHFLEAKE